MPRWDSLNFISRQFNYVLYVVLDDDDPTITAGSIVTVTVELTRRNMKDIMEGGEALGPGVQEVQEAEEEAEEAEEKTEETAATESPVRKPKVWEKQQKKKKGGKKKSKPKPQAAHPAPVVKKVEEKEEEGKSEQGTPNGVSALFISFSVYLKL
jgi:translocation protein SEC63